MFCSPSQPKHQERCQILDTWSTQILYNLIQTKMTDSRFMHMQQPWHSLGSLLHKEYIPIHCIYDNIVNQSVWMVPIVHGVLFRCLGCALECNATSSKKPNTSWAISSWDFIIPANYSIFSLFGSTNYAYSLFRVCLRCRTGVLMVAEQSVGVDPKMMHRCSTFIVILIKNKDIPSLK